MISYKQTLLDLNSPESESIICDILEDTSLKIWLKNKTYTTIKKQEYKFEFNIIFCEQEKTYKIIGNNSIIINSNRTEIFPINASFKIINNKISFIESTPEIIKVLKPYGFIYEDFLKKSQYEFQQSKIINHLGIKNDLLINNSKAYILMNRMPGEDILDFSRKLSKYHIKLHAIDLLKITYACLLSIRSQVTDYEMVHLDIKPDNLVIDTDIKFSNTNAKYSSLNYVAINTIDYDFSLNFNETIQNHGSRGSLEYISPEVLNEKYFNDYKNLKEKPDVYAAGITIQLLWKLYAINQTNKTLTEFACNRIYNRFFAIQESSIPKDTFIQICLLSTNMTLSNPYHRYSLDEAIRVFEYILHISKMDKNPVYVATTGYENNLEEICPNKSFVCLKNNSGTDLLYNKDTFLRANSIPYATHMMKSPTKQSTTIIKNNNIYSESLKKTNNLTSSCNITSIEANININKDCIFKIHEKSSVCFNSISEDFLKSISTITETFEKVKTGTIKLVPQNNCLKNRSGNTWPFWEKNPLRNSNSSLDAIEKRLNQCKIK